MTFLRELRSVLARRGSRAGPAGEAAGYDDAHATAIAMKTARASALLALVVVLSGLAPALATGASPPAAAGSQPGTAAPRAAMGDGSAQLSLPWAPGEPWMLTGGPHGSPVGNALDFDFAGGVGRVRAAREGIALVSCPNTVRVDHLDGWSTVYAHVDQVAVESGQFVARGQELGLAADVPSCALGSSEGTHLHFGVLRDGRPYDIDGMAIGGWTVQGGARAYEGCLWRGEPPGAACEPGIDVANGGAVGGGGSEDCLAPELLGPGFDAVSRTRSVAFTWGPGRNCPQSAYDFRIKTVPAMDDGGVTLIDRPQLAATQRTEELPIDRYEQDLYWGVRAAGMPGAEWSVRRFRIQPSPDVAAPSIVWKAPRQQDEAIQVVASGTVLLHAQATDNVGVRRVDFVRWDAGGNRVLLGSDDKPSGANEYTSSVFVASLDPDWNRIGATAIDAAGNQTTQHIWLFRTMPGDAPIAVSIKRPSDGQSVSTNRAPINIAASDGFGSYGALRVEYQVDGGPFVAAPFDPGTGRYRHSWDTTALPDGLHQLRARATDFVGRSVLSAPVEVLVDNVNAPPVADAGPDQTVVDLESSDGEIVQLDGSGSSYDPELSATFEWFRIDGGSAVPIGQGERIETRFGLEGTLVRLVVTDSRGQQASDEMVVFVDLPEGTPNDDFYRAEPVLGLPFKTWMHARTATTAADDPPACVPMRRTVWYAFTPTVSEQIAIDTEDSSYDTALAVYTGDRGQLARVACDGTGWDSRVRFNAVAGTTYYVMVGSVGSRDGGFFELHFQIGRGSDDTTKPGAWWISPVVRWDGPEDSPVITSPTVLLSAQAWDFQSGVERVEFGAWWQGSWRPVTKLYAPSRPNVYEYVWDMCAAGVPDGDVAFGLQVYDRAGNETVYSHQWTNIRIEKRFACARDETPPAVQFQAPVANGKEHRVREGTVALRVQATDPSGIRTVIFERRDELGQVVPIAVANEAPYTAAIVVDELHLGRNDVSAIAFDGAGNVTERSIRILREPLPPKTPSIAAPATVRVGEPVDVSLANFPAGVPVTLFWDDVRQTSIVTTETGDGAGSFPAPPAPRGAHTLRASVGGASATATVRVAPSLALEPADGARGETVSVTLRGFLPGERIQIRWHDAKKGKQDKGGKNGKRNPGRPKPKPVASAAADGEGTASASFSAPAGARLGGHKVTAAGGRGSAAGATFTLVIASSPDAVADAPRLSAPAASDDATPSAADPQTSEAVLPAGTSPPPGGGPPHSASERENRPGAKGGNRDRRDGKRDRGGRDREKAKRDRPKPAAKATHERRGHAQIGNVRHSRR